MAILFMGGEISALIPSDSTVKESTASSGYYDSAFARCYILCDKATNYAETPDIGSTLTDAWIHFDMAIRASGSGSTAHPRLVWLDDSGVERVRLTHRYDTNAVALQYDVGAGWVTAGSTIALDLSARQTIDINIVCNSASGSLTLYVAGTERITSGTVDLSVITELNQARFYGASISSLGFGTGVSQVIIGSESTIGMRLMTGYPSGNGASTAWTADYASVDETVYSDADFIFSSTNGQRETFAMTTVGSLTGYSVRAVAVAARAKRGSSGPANLQLTVYTASTNYDSASLALSLGYSAYVNVWEDDPNTTIDWTNTNAAAIQFGVEANT